MEQKAAKETTDEGKKRAHRRYADAVLALSKAFALTSATDAARAIREEVAFFQAIRAALIKSVPGDGKATLDEVSKILGLTGKPEGVDGSCVEEMVQAGQIEEVARYCDRYRVWLVYELFRGAITPQELDWSERQIRDFVVGRKTANQHLCKAVGIAGMNTR